MVRGIWYNWGTGWEIEFAFLLFTWSKTNDSKLNETMEGEWKEKLSDGSNIVNGENDGGGDGDDGKENDETTRDVCSGCERKYNDSVVGESSTKMNSTETNI